MLDAMLDGPTATIDLLALDHNLARLRRRLTSGSGVLAAVKADGYGHGAVEVARRLAQQGVAWFGVATPDEALELRAAGIAGDLLLFGPCRDRASLQRLAEADVAVTIVDEAGLEAVRGAGLDRPLRCHLKIDTGMGRLGRPWPDAVELARALDREPRTALEGVWTHLARADEPDRAPTLAQLERFEQALAALRRDGIPHGLRHVANSAGLLAFPEAHYDLVRPGIALYGYAPSPEIRALEPELRPAMTLQAPVTFVKRVPAGTAVSYGGRWTASRATTVATVRIGYADGYPRQLSNLGSVDLAGRRVEVAGRVCMDQLMLDVGDDDVVPGDVATLWGPAGPDAEALAAAIGTISYELLTGVGRRVQRRYRGD